MEFIEQDLDILPPKVEDGNIKYKQDLDKRLPNCHRGLCGLLLGVPGCGKTCLLLNFFGRFLKYYYENIYFVAASKDPTLQSLFDFYGPPEPECNDRIINNIIQSQYDQDEDDDTQFPRTNAALIIDDALAMKQFNSRKSTSLSRMASNYRHILRGHLPHQKDGDKFKTHGGGGLLLISTQRYGSTIPTSFKSCCNLIIVGKLANRQEFEAIIDDYGDRVGGQEALREMINMCNNIPFGFLSIYLDGDLDPETTGPVVYLNMKDKLYPTERFPQKNIQI